MKKKTMKLKYQAQGHCPKCNSTNLNYMESNLEGDSIGYDFDCNDCQYEGVEWYDLKYSETR